MNIGIYIYDKAEVLDFSGPFEVFTTASRVCPNEDPFKVFLIGETGEMVAARADYRVKPKYGFYNHPPIDALIVVGGFHYEEIKKVNVLEWIVKQASQAQYIANQNVTTHWEDISELQESFPALNVQENARWVDEGKIITSAGISAGIDMSLHLVSKFHSLILAEKTARQMEYEWVKK